MSTTATKTIPMPSVRTAEPGAGGYLSRAVAMHLAGQRAEALAKLRRGIAAGEASPGNLRAMGHIQFEMEDFDNAAKTYRTLTELKPQYAMGWFNLAVSLERL